MVKNTHFQTTLTSNNPLFLTDCFGGFITLFQLQMLKVSNLEG